MASSRTGITGAETPDRPGEGGVGARLPWSLASRTIIVLPLAPRRTHEGTTMASLQTLCASVTLLCTALIAAGCSDDKSEDEDPATCGCTCACANRQTVGPNWVEPSECSVAGCESICQATSGQSAIETNIQGTQYPACLSTR